MSKFVRVTNGRYGDKLIINIDSIAWIGLDSRTVCLNGVHGENHGLLTFNEADMQKILADIALRKSQLSHPPKDSGAES